MRKETGAKDKKKPAENGDINVKMEGKNSMLHISDHDSWTFKKKLPTEYGRKADMITVMRI